MFDCIKKTRRAVLGTSLLNEPLFTLYNLIAFILHKDLHATAFQIAVLVMLRPMVSIISLYWSSLMKGRLVANVVWSGVLSRLPFFFFPFIDSPWAIILSVAFYMMVTRGGMPAWMEILKRNLPDKRGMIYSYGSAFAYMEGVLLAIGVGYLLDNYSQAWRWLFPIAALIGLYGVWMQSRLTVVEEVEKEEPSPVGMKEMICQPWRNAWDLMKRRPNFRSFQWGLMIGGFGIMIVQPALPLFFVDTLGLSYTDLAIALSICKGIGFALTSPVWGKGFHRMNFYGFSSLVFVLMGIFPLCLLFAHSDLAWLYLAYTIYGVAQAGSHLGWNLSGTIFAEKEDSALYSSVNVVMVGLRGCMAPPLGSALCVLASPILVLGAGAILCFLSGIFFYRCKRTEVLIPS